MTAPTPRNPAPAATTAGQAGGSFLRRKVGPLPVWIWMALGLLGALVYANYAKSKTTAADDSGSTDATDATNEANNQPPMVFQDYVTITPGGTPPVGGRTSPPPAAPNPPPAGSTPPPPPTTTTPPPTTTPLPKPPPKAAPVATPAPKTATVTVAKFTTKNPPWNSTLSGIAGHYKIKSWETIWNSPANAALKSRRKDPSKIQPGDKIVVPLS